MARDDRLRDEIEQLFADLWQVPRYTGLRRGFRPAADCYRTESPPALTVVLELPGVDPAAVQIAVTARELVVSGERPRPVADGRHFEQIEIAYGPFERRVSLAEDVATDDVKASYEDGLLTVRLPLARRRGGPVRVPVDTGEPGKP